MYTCTFQHIADSWFRPMFSSENSSSIFPHQNLEQGSQTLPVIILYFPAQSCTGRCVNSNSTLALLSPLETKHSLFLWSNGFPLKPVLFYGPDDTNQRSWKTLGTCSDSIILWSKSLVKCNTQHLFIFLPKRLRQPNHSDEISALSMQLHVP